MYHGGSRLVVWILLGIFSASGGLTVCAQSSDDPSAAPVAAVFQELPFQVYLRRSEDGELVLVPDFSLEEYLRLYEQATSSAAQRPPKYVIRDLEVSGEIRTPRADLTTRLVIERVAGGSAAKDGEEAWLAVPLRMGEGALREAPTFEGDGRAFVTYDIRSRGYVLWWYGGPLARIDVRLGWRIGVAARNGTRSLAWSLPAATNMQWRVMLREPVHSLELVGDGAMETRSTGPDRTETVGTGMRGDLQLTWKTQAAGASVPWLDVDGDIRVTVSGIDQVTSEAILTCRRNDGEPKEIQVRIPPGMALRALPDSLFKFEQVEEDTGDGALFTISPQTPSSVTGDWVVRLVCEASDGAPGNAQWEPARFVVVGATRQRGRVVCDVEGEWVVMADVGPRVTRVAGTALEFRYHAQPARLSLTVRRRLARGRVESTHECRVERDRVSLASRFAFTFAGASPRQLQIDCRGWRLVDALLGGEPLARPARQDQDGTVTFDFTTEAVVGNNVELELFLEQAVEAQGSGDSQTLRLRLPRAIPFAEGTLFVAPATLTVERTADVELIPLVAEFTGLVFVTDDTNAATDAKLTLRERGSRENAVFAALLRTYDRSVQVDEEVLVSEASGQWRWTQFLTYRIDYQPGSRLRFAVPEPRDGRRWEDFECVVLEDPQDRGPWTADRPRLPLRPVEGLSEASLPDGWTVLEAIIPTPRLGPLTIAIHTRIPVERPADTSTWKVEVPWWRPVAVDETSVIRGEQRLTLQASGQVRATIGGADWSDIMSATGALQWIAPEPVEEGTVSLTLSLAESTWSSDVMIHRRWIQTWITQTERRDRVVWNLSSERRVLRIELPDGFAAAEKDVYLAVDGKRVPSLERGSDGQMSVALDPQDIGRPLVVEFWYRQRRPFASRRLRLQTPRVAQSQPPAMTYWQVVVPFTDHFWSVAADWSPEVRWRPWGGIWWRREWPAQEDFERWSGASFQPPLPDTVHAYAFSTFGAPSEIELRTVPRAWLVVGASGAILIFGWLVLSFRWSRNPAVLLVLAAVVVGGVLWSPFLAATIAEAAVIGLVCLVVALWLHWFVQRPRAMRPVAVSASPSGQLAKARADSGVTTATAPAVAHGSSVNAVR